MINFIKAVTITVTAIICIAAIIIAIPILWLVITGIILLVIFIGIVATIKEMYEIEEERDDEY